MAPISAKRARVAAVSSEAKKARVIDPVAEKVDLVSKTISDPACHVSGPESHRDMLLFSIPHTLAVPCDERHEFQVQMAQMINKVLTDHVVNWEKQVSDSQAEVLVTAQKSKDAMSVVEASATTINTHEEEVEKRKGIVGEDGDAVKVAETTLESAKTEVAEFDGELQKTIDQKDQCGSIYNECFAALKSGSIESKEAPKLLKKIEPMLKKLSIESSLLSALAPALKKSPEERGPFDIMAVDGAEAIFTKHLGALQEQIDKADVVKAEKVSAEASAQEALNAATEKRTASEAVLKNAEDELVCLEAKHKDFLEECNTSYKVEEDCLGHQVMKADGLAKAKEVLSAFTELLERPSTIEEPAAEADVAMVEDKLEAIGEPIQMEAVAVA